MVLEAEWFKLFALVLIRFSGVMATAPVLGSGSVPMMLRAAIAAATALLVTPLIAPLADPLPSDPYAYGFLAAGELVIGLCIGFVVTLVFAAVQMGGQIIDMQSGFGMMNIFNPAAETQFPVFGFFLFILAVFFLLAIDGHHVILRAAAASYEHIPPGGFQANGPAFGELARRGAWIFSDGLIIAAPVAAAMFLAYGTLGLLGRVVPQIHLFIIGFPLTMALAMLVMATFIGLYLELLDGMFSRIFRDLVWIGRVMG
ncbi:MAG TPA: flagellar biosynthetic protein FliR [Candidatus Hydrogenedentes bacterium]|nr:flagellar biosynthetic protein FliR [Candidatus Hydrogenedentota bacterium]HPU98404.1 flagellar biosynthetic protein FliR [Candidatus Hydrogenedentota bacterium]